MKNYYCCNLKFDISERNFSSVPTAACFAKQKTCQKKPNFPQTLFKQILHPVEMLLEPNPEFQEITEPQYLRASYSLRDLGSVCQQCKASKIVLLKAKLKISSK